MSERYSRLTLIPWWDQEKLRSSSALVVGAGALGNEIIKNLSLLGLGTIHVVDMDMIESSNLSRSVLFRQQDVGRYKAEVVADRAREINPDVKVITHIGKFEEKIGLDLLREMDLIFAGLDSRLARLNVGRACRLIGKPWIDGAIEALHGIVRVFGATGPCYECTLNEVDLELISNRKSCALISKEEVELGKIPTTPTMASIVSGFEVQEGIKLLHKERKLPILEGKAFFLNGLTHDSYQITYSEKPDCQSHETFDEFIELNTSHADSIATLAKEVRSKFGDQTTVLLRREIVVAERCVECKTERLVGLAPQEWKKLSHDCRCGKSVQPILSQSLSDLEIIPNLTLADLLVPDREILSAYLDETVVGLILRAVAKKDEVAA